MKVCFVALSAYPMLAGKKFGHIVGPDVHTVLLGRELVKHGFPVAFITYDEDGPSGENIDGIEVIKAYRFTDISRLDPVRKALRVWKAMRKADADIYFHHSGAYGVISLFSRILGKKLIYNTASDREVDKQAKGLNAGDRFRLWVDFKLAHAIVNMNDFQKRMLKQNYGRKGVVIRHHFPLTGPERPEKASPPVVLWVGSIAEVKQPELFLELAEAMPDVKFRMIAARGDSDEYYSDFRDTAAKISNLEFLGFVPFQETGPYYEKASVLVNTSVVEGFPYAFLQAWMAYTPVVSLNADPDGVITKYRLGFHSGTFEKMAEDIRTLLNNKQLSMKMGEAARQYVEDNHDIAKIVEQYIEIFNGLAKPEKSGQRGAR